MPGWKKLFYQSALSLLQYGGVMVFIVPALRARRRAGRLADRHFAELRIYRAVETQFKQVVIFGRKVRQRDQVSMASRPRALLLQIGLGGVEAEELPERMAVPAVHRCPPRPSRSISSA